MTRHRLLLLTCVFAGVVTAAVLSTRPAAAASHDYRTTWKGSYWCTDHGTSFPLQGARVELVERLLDWDLIGHNPLTDKVVGVAHTDGDGGWQMTTRSSDEATFFVRLLLDDNETVRLEDGYASWPWYTDSGTNENDVPLHDLGRTTIQVDGGSGTPFCSVWSRARQAVAQYRAVTGSPPPYGRLVIHGGALNAGVPFSPYTTIVWPTDFGWATPKPGSTEGAGVVYHEFGHTIRHALDGTFDHFTDDVVGYVYTQQHTASSCDNTNLGFAFNEGWADYWEWQAQPPRDGTGRVGVNAKVCPDPLDYGVEANVARALVSLDLRCTNYTPAAFVRTLTRSDGDIHSYVEFEEQAKAVVGPCAKAAFPPLASLPTQAKPPPPWRSQLADSRNALTAIDRTATKVRASLAAARRAAAATCAGKPCAGSLAARVRVPLLQGELQQAAAVRRILAPFATPAQAQQAAKLSPSAFLATLDQTRRAIGAEVGALQARATKRALAPAVALRKADGTATTAALLSRLQTMAHASAATTITPQAPKPGGGARCVKTKTGTTCSSTASGG